MSYRAQFLPKHYGSERNGTRIGDYYIMGSKVGEGGKGGVFKATSHLTGHTRAVKVIQKDTEFSVSTSQHVEIPVMTILDHPNIVRLIETFESKTRIYLVMEYCYGGTITDMASRIGGLTEMQVAIYMNQILRALYHMHRQTLSHGDLHCRNIMVKENDPPDKLLIKIIDFGQANVTNVAASDAKDKEMRDLEACGQIMRTLLRMGPSRSGTSARAKLRKQTCPRTQMTGEELAGISEEAQDLLGSLLSSINTVNHSMKFSAKEALLNPWFRRQLVNVENITIPREVMDRFTAFQMHSKMKRAALRMIIDQVEDREETRKLRDVADMFRAVDTNGDGFLTPSELKQALKDVGVTVPGDLTQIMEDLDIEGIGVIDYGTFVASMLDETMYTRSHLVKVGFQLFDHDHDGSISQVELTNLLNDADVGCPKHAETIFGIITKDLEADSDINLKTFSKRLDACVCIKSTTANDRGSGKTNNPDDLARRIMTERRVVREAKTRAFHVGKLANSSPNKNNKARRIPSFPLDGKADNMKCKRASRRINPAWTLSTLQSYETLSGFHEAAQHPDSDSEPSSASSDEDWRVFQKTGDQMFKEKVQTSPVCVPEFRVVQAQSPHGFMSGSIILRHKVGPEALGMGTCGCSRRKVVVSL